MASSHMLFLLCEKICSCMKLRLSSSIKNIRWWWISNFHPSNFYKASSVRKFTANLIIKNFVTYNKLYMINLCNVRHFFLINFKMYECTKPDRIIIFYFIQFGNHTWLVIIYNYKIANKNQWFRNGPATVRIFSIKNLRLHLL